MNTITIETYINVPLEKVWDYFTNPSHVTGWNFAHESWQCPKAESNLVEGGTFSYRMEAKDGSFGFDLNGFFDEIKTNELLKYHLEDDRKVEVTFNENNGVVTVTQTFEPESQNPPEMQEQGWKAILENFKTYTEKN